MSKAEAEERMKKMNESPSGQDYLPCCQAAQVDITEQTALILLIINFLCPGFGTWISAFIDKRGCNWTALIVGWAQSALTSIFVGWLWGIYHMYCQWNYSKTYADKEGGSDDLYSKLI